MPPTPPPPRMVWMKAPTGEMKEVPATSVDFFRKNGAVLIGEPDYQGPVEPSTPVIARPQAPPGYEPVEEPMAQAQTPGRPSLGQPTAMRAATPWERFIGPGRDIISGTSPISPAAAQRMEQVGRPPVQPMSAMRAPTLTEKANQAYGDVAQWASEQPVGRVMDMAGLSNFGGVARQQRGEEPIPPMLGMMPDLPGVGLGKKLAGEAAEALVTKAAKAVKAKPVTQIEGGGFEKFKETARRGFQFQPIDDAAKARLTSFKPGEKFSFAKLTPSARPKKIYDSIVAPGSNGYSVHPGTGQLVEGGKPGPRMVGIFPNSSNKTAVIPLADFKPRDVEKFMLNNRAEFAKDQTLFIGGWQSKIDGVPHVFLDVVKPADTSRMATKIGELQNPGGKIRAGKVMPKQNTGIVRKPDGTWPKGQNAIFEPERFDPANDNYGEAPVGNHAEFVGSEDFQDRVKEMAGVGRVLMKDGNWWDIRGGPMEEVYGPDMMEKVAGYTASTSPQNPPRPNLRMASELIRRDIKGEPVHDPNWVAPADAMGEGFSPGPGMPMPAPDTWKNNATKVREGRPETMFDDKVNDMFHAMIGKLVGVYDRHWAKLAEDPARGIYTDNVINKISGSMKSGVLEAYPLIENAVRTAAKRAGVDVAKYSAWAWEGIRHTIKTTGELYGQKHSAGAIPEGNEGFNEIFAQLLGEKAAHMKISVPELKARLRSGDASLLTALLATPVGAAAYAKWRDSVSPTRKDGGT